MFDLSTFFDGFRFLEDSVDFVFDGKVTFDVGQFFRQNNFFRIGQQSLAFKNLFLKQVTFVLSLRIRKGILLSISLLQLHKCRFPLLLNSLKMVIFAEFIKQIQFSQILVFFDVGAFFLLFSVFMKWRRFF